MELTKGERLILANQFEILAVLGSEDDLQKKTYLEKKRIVEMGVSSEWDQLFGLIEENKMTYEDCQEVRNILTMYNDIQWSYENLNNKDGIDKDKIIFKGFDLNFESERYEYINFLLKPGVTDEFLPQRANDLNSHCSMLEEYRTMYSKYEKIKERKSKELDEEQIKLLLM